MKKAIDVNIGGVKFPIEEDAYIMLKEYLTRFELSMDDKDEAKEVMEDVEMRVAELFQKEVKFPNQVIDVRIVQAVISCLGDVNVDENVEDKTQESETEVNMKANKRLYRNPDDEKLAGVCSGIAAYFDIDSTLVRIIFLAALFAYGSTFWIYIAIWVIAPQALTVPQKLEMRGIPVTAENIRKYTTERAA